MLNMKPKPEYSPLASRPAALARAVANPLPWPTPRRDSTPAPALPFVSQDLHIERPANTTPFDLPALSRHPAAGRVPGKNVPTQNKSEPDLTNLTIRATHRA